MTASLRVIARDQLDFLALRPIKPDLKNDYARYLAWGLSATWLAGMGRYWDNPKAALWQKAGLGSLAYVFVMAALIWLIAAPLRPRGWSYRTVLLFVTLTSPPAILYAIPVEMFMSFSAAAAANAVFLLVVATWRVVLLANYSHADHDRARPPQSRTCDLPDHGRLRLRHGLRCGVPRRARHDYPVLSCEPGPGGHLRLARLACAQSRS
jgi:hypothetical protein